MPVDVQATLTALSAEDRAILEAVHREMDEDDDGNAPGHGHRLPGIWDDDNGELAGKPCAWCLTWTKFTRLVREGAAAGARVDAPAQPKLAVWFGSMPESNGKKNWTAVLHRGDRDISEGLTLDRSEYHDRVRYEADRARHLIGELPESPDILAYDPELRDPDHVKEGHCG